MIEQRPYLHLLEESFPGIKANIARCERVGFPWQSRPFLKEERGELVSHVGLLEYPIVVDGRKFKVGVLHAICTKATHRGRGFASELIHEALNWEKERYDCIVLFTEIPNFYEKLSFQCIQEHRFHLSCRHPKGKKPLHPMQSPKDDALFIRCFKDRAALSSHLWVHDNGTIACFNTLFATYPTYWSLHYSPSIDGIISFLLDFMKSRFYAADPNISMSQSVLSAS